MRSGPVTALLLLALVGALALLPQGAATGWRISLLGLARQLRSEPAEPPAAPDAAADLRSLADAVRQRDAEIAELRTRLQRLEEGREALPRLRFVLASFAGPGEDPLGDGCLIDRGARDGVAKGDAAVQGRAFAGLVSRAGPDAASVVFLTSRLSLVPARAVPPSGETARGREICAVRGDGRGRAKAVFYGPAPRARKGWTLLTAGLAGAVPPDLVIGVLAEDPTEAADPDVREAALSLSADLASPDDLLIVRRLPSPPQAKPKETEAEQPPAAKAAP